jgi:hypothetical protein
MYLEELKNKAIAKAWKEPEFKKRLKSNPKEALKEIGWDLTKKKEVKIIEDTEETFTLVIPSSPSNIKSLSEKELVDIAGGNCDPTTGSCVVVG